jgi:ADP-heptose:LPS heptosyltransferase
MKILIIRFSSIGDVVLTTPVVRCLSEQLPDAEIHFITKAAFATVLENNPHIDRIITIAASVKEKIEELKAERYDYVIDLHNNVRTLRLKRALGRPSYSFPKKNVRKFLLTTFKWNRMPDVHVVDRYFEAVKPLGVHPDGKPADLFLQSEDRYELSAAQLEPKQFIAVAMGAQFATKQMPVRLMAEVLSGAELPIALLGGPGDAERASELISLLETQHVVDFCGKTNLRQSAFVLSQARVLLTGDTGLMHMATAFGVPIVSVWGNTVPDFGMYPYVPSAPEQFSIHEVKGLSCRPCSKIGYQECPKKHFRCMLDQDAGAIAADLRKRVV